MDDLETFLSYAFARQVSGPPPVMRCRLEGRQGRDAMEMYYRQDLAKYESSFAAGEAGEVVKMTQTMAAPLTHGVAPALERCTAISLAETATAVNSIWTGRVLFVRTTAPCLRVVATSFLVEDEAGDRIGAHLYNLVARDEDPRSRFAPGTRLALLEPYMRHAKDDARTGVLMLRCDNPQAVVVFESEAEWLRARELARLRQQGLVVAPDAPAATVTLDPGRADEFCAAGNAAFKAKAYDKALRLYSASLEHAPSHVRALSNRCAVHMRCERWRAALVDAEAVLRCEPQHMKCRLRAAACLLSLCRVDEARAAAAHVAEDLAAADAEQALQREADELVKDISRAAAEQRGEYDLKALRREAAASSDKRLSWRHAEFESAALRVEATATKGRRVVALEPLPAGTLLMANKALAFVLCSDSDAAAISVAANSTVDRGSQSFMLPVVVQTLLNRPEIGEALYSLSGGATYPPMSASDGADPTRVDVKRIDAILSNNWFQAGSNMMQLQLDMRAWAERLGRNPTAAEQQRFGEEHRAAGTGLWVRPSLLNHSCAPNCLIHQEGDFLFVIAARHVEAGEEVRAAVALRFLQDYLNCVACLRRHRSCASHTATPTSHLPSVRASSRNGTAARGSSATACAALSADSNQASDSWRRTSTLPTSTLAAATIPACQGSRRPSTQPCLVPRAAVHLRALMTCRLPANCRCAHCWSWRPPCSWQVERRQQRSRLTRESRLSVQLPWAVAHVV